MKILAMVAAAVAVIVVWGEGISSCLISSSCCLEGDAFPCWQFYRIGPSKEYRNKLSEESGI